MEDFEREAADIRVQMDATGTPFAAAAKRLSYVTLQGIAYNESVPAVVRVMPSIPDPTTPIPRLDGARARGNFVLEGAPRSNAIGGVCHDECQHPWCQAPSSGAPARDHRKSRRRRRHCKAR